MKRVLHLLSFVFLAAAIVACTEKEFYTPEEITSEEEGIVSEGDFSYVFKVGSDATKTSFGTDHIV